MAKDRYAKVSVEGREWDYRVPDFLSGKLEAGDVVAVFEEETGNLLVGEVAGFSPVTTHRERNVRTIVDKIRLKRWFKHVEGREDARLLMDAMAKRLEEIEAVKAYEAAAKDDDEMMALYEDYAESLR